MDASVDVTVIVRVATFGAALVLAMVLLKIVVQRWLARQGPIARRWHDSLGAIVSYVLLVLYVAAVQARDGFDTPLSWVTGLGQAGVILGAIIGVRDVFVIKRPARRKRQGGSA